MNRLKRFVGAGVLFLFPASAFALSDFNASNLSSLTQTTVQDLIKTIAIGADHRAYMSATALPWNIGVDAGLEATVIRLPQSFKSTIATAAQKSEGDVPALIPVPRFNLHKGLPFGLELGFSYIGYQDKVKVFGGEAKWNFVQENGIVPAVAFRFSGTSEQIWFLKATTWKTDFVVSKDLFFIDPYVGLGLQFWSGNIEVPTNLPAGQGLPASVSASASGTNMHFYTGVPLKLGLFWLTAEMDYSTAGIFSFGSKFSFNF